MPIGNASIKRAAGAINKPEEKSKNAAFSAKCVLIDLEVSKIEFDGEEIDVTELKKSVKKFGVLHPVFVLRSREKFVLVSGKARLTAAKELGLQKVPAVVLEMEGSGESAAKKDVFVRRAASAHVQAEAAVTENIHERKFGVVKSIGHDLPDYLL